MLWYKDCESRARLDGKSAIVTGSNQGLGKLTVKDLYLRGCRVVMACRNVEKAEEARKEIMAEAEGKEGLGELLVRQLDLSSLESVRKFAEITMREDSQINLLVNNAGCGGVFGLTSEGFDITFGSNHIGPFLLTMLLLPRILNSAPARIVNVTSFLYLLGRLHLDDIPMTKRDYWAINTYSTSKLANILFTQELARRLKGTGVTVYAPHPGFTYTSIITDLPAKLFAIVNFLAWPLYTSPEKGVQTQIHCCVDEGVAAETGLFYSNCRPFPLLPHGRNPDDAAKLWSRTWELVGLGNFDPFKMG